MQEPADTELLRQYAEQDSETAFAALVTRHINLVYSAAWRKTGNPHAAEEITQAVFIILAKKARALRRETVLSGWLYQTARLTAANFLRNEIRRVRREQEAYMQSLSDDTEAWPHIGPLLDDAMGRLNEKERNAVVLRFFEGKSFQEIGTAFGGTENAAKKRVIRGLEKLRSYFSRQGVNSTTTAIAETISANSVQAAPLALAKTISAVALAKGATASTSTLTLIKGALKLMAWTKAKTAIVTGAAVLFAVGTTVITVKAISHHPGSSAAAQSDTITLQGSWSGQEAGGGGPGSISLVIQGSSLEFHGADPREWYKATFSLREDTTPKQMVAMITDCPAPGYVGKSSRAIYQMQDGTLTITGNEPGNPAVPANFDVSGARKIVFTKK